MCARGGNIGNIGNIDYNYMIIFNINVTSDVTESGTPGNISGVATGVDRSNLEAN